jgi:MSHA pilin protein MshC
LSRAAEVSGGWTLPELVVVVAVLAIIAAIAAPRAFDSEVLRARAYASEVAAAARLARTVALTSGCAVRLSIDNAGFEARQPAIVGSHCANAGFARIVLRADGTDLQGTAPASLPAVGNLQWTFRPDGTVSTQGANTASWAGHTVSVDTGSGAVTGP